MDAKPQKASNFLLDVTINKFILKEVGCMQEMFIHAEEVRKLLGISRSKAYGIVRQLNDELKERGLITLNDKVSRKYFMEKIYGSENADKQ
jgi:hypothetical protein